MRELVPASDAPPIGRNLHGRNIVVLMGEEAGTSQAELERQLRQSNLLMESTRLFYAKIVHDIRTPLSSVPTHALC